MDSHNPPSMRVLIRPPNSTPTQPTLSPPIPPPHQTNPPALPPLPPPPSLPPSPQNGVVVVGFIGRRSGDVTQLINRILDANVFGSGNFDKNFCAQKVDIEEDVKIWFKFRKISYYHDDEKGILYLQFSSTGCPAMEDFSESSRFDSVLEERDIGDLQGMLFMFSVCHVIIFIQEGSRLDTQILKKFRILQAAKHAMVPYVRSQTTPPSTSKPHSSSRTSSNNRSPGRSSGILSRNASAISFRSGLGSYTSLFPGQCTPVILFVFLDDISASNIGSNVEETIETSSLNQSSSLSSLARTSLPMKGSGPVVVLARPVSKSEGGFKKKLQSSLETQIRFSIKRCRTLTVAETSHVSSRSGSISNSAPLFSLDASKAVVLLDRYPNQMGESLDFATGLIEDVLNGKATSDFLLLESHSQSAAQEEILSVKEFIYRQADILRGRGGLVTNANSGSAAVVGMVAVAAAAAAASAASGRNFTTPELPSIGIWLSSSQPILYGILSAKRGCIIESESSKRNPREKSTVTPEVEGIVVSRVPDPLEIAVSCLESGKGLDAKFSTSWCQRALPAAKEVYLNELPDCYPTSRHEEQLEKALRAFSSMVKGPAVQIFMKKLEDECTTIWSSGRQLCDEVSLTGKPCIHQRHSVETDGLISKDGVKPHSSGFVFLQACACGRSRKIRSDPFDFKTANITSDCFPDCDKLLPALKLPQVKNAGPIQPSSWSLIRIGDAKYYDPSKGLLQSGFSAAQKFLSKWKIFIDKSEDQDGSLVSAVQQGSVNGLSAEPLNESVVGGDIKKSDASRMNIEELRSGNKLQRELPLENNQSDEKKIGFGRGIPNFTMRKPFSEVVAGSAAVVSEFPPLKSRKQLPVGPENGIMQMPARERGPERVHHTAVQKSEDFPVVQGTEYGNGICVNGGKDHTPNLQIGSYIVPMNISSGEKIKLRTSLKNVTVYVGFEHECPRGHRFVLNSEHLKELGSPYSLSEESHIPSSIVNSDNKRADPSKLGKNGNLGKAHQNSNRMNTSVVRKVRNLDKTQEVSVDGNVYLDGVERSSRTRKEETQSHIGMATLNDSVKDLEESRHTVNLDDDALSLLNRNIPIYMNCPHCRISKNKNAPSKIKFAGTISQLQRIFFVTPPFPVILATCPVIQFEKSCLPPSEPDREHKLQFNFECDVILPPESFLSLRLPFVYGVQLEDGSLQSLRPFDHNPELTAWIAKGRVLQVMSKGSNLCDGYSDIKIKEP